MGIHLFFFSFSFSIRCLMVVHAALKKNLFLTNNTDVAILKILLGTSKSWGFYLTCLVWT